MSYLEDPLQPGRRPALRAGGRWLRQAAVLGLGVGLLAGTGLIVTASVASAHSAAPASAASHGPARACALVIGRPGHLRARPLRCRLPMALGLASPVCKGRLVPAQGFKVRLIPPHGKVAIARPLRLPRAVHLGKHPRLPVLRVRACAAPLLRLRPTGVRRLCGNLRPVRLKLFGAPRPARVRIPLAVRPGHIKLMAPARACSLVPVTAKR